MGCPIHLENMIYSKAVLNVVAKEGQTTSPPQTQCARGGEKVFFMMMKVESMEMEMVVVVLVVVLVIVVVVMVVVVVVVAEYYDCGGDEDTDGGDIDNADVDCGSDLNHYGDGDDDGAVEGGHFDSNIDFSQRRAWIRCTPENGILFSAGRNVL